jgi:SAM-dependent methyltransferase
LIAVDTSFPVVLSTHSFPNPPARLAVTDVPGPEERVPTVSTASDLRNVFQGREVHAAWEAVYRRDRRQQRFYDRLLGRIVRWLDLPAGSRVLDAGCGTGEHTVRLAELGYRCVGVDVSPRVLLRAAERARARGQASRIRFHNEGLEALPFPDGAFDAVHCRGVLMHVPRWERALAELCRVLRPGGKIALLENNHRCLDMLLVRLVRLLRKGESRLVRTPGGLEFWVDREGEAPLTRVADLGYTAAQLESHGVRVVKRFATEFWDLNRFPAGLPRRAALGFNRLWFALHLPARPSRGNALIGQKAA